MTVDPLVLMTDVDQATERLIRTAEGLEGGAQAAPSGLPGWTIGHVLTHVARNAEAYTNLLTWARTGVETPAYPSPTARDEGIEKGAGRPVAGADRRPARGARALRRRRRGDAGRGLDVRPARDRPVRRGRCPGPGCARSRCTTSTWAAPTPRQDWTDAFALRLLREIAGDLKDAAPALILRPHGLTHELTIGAATGATPMVGGPTRAIAAWLAGRGDGADLTVAPDGELPTPARWK